MDRISESLLNEFSAENGIGLLPEDKRFEHFCSYVIVRRLHSETFDSEDIVTGSGNDTGIDGVAILVNGSLVTDTDTLEEQSGAGYLDATFVFVSAERSANFDASTVGRFGFGVMDFFKEQPSMIRNLKITTAAETMNAVYKLSSKFKRGNPICRLYYATTGKWMSDQTITARMRAVASDLEATNLFREVEFSPIDADALHKLYRQTKNAISREFTFAKKTVVPDIPGVTQAYLGILPAKELLKLFQDDNGEMIRGLFYDNVRDWLDFNEVNNEIKATLETKDRNLFVLMNNGITIIARQLQPTGDRMYIEDYSIVNGCQTSHVLFEERETIDDSVMVPVRLIGTSDETIINSIIRATNRQTEVKEEQFFALQEFSKSLEQFFQAFPDPNKIYYERRTHQYDRMAIERTRIITPANMIRAFAGMFLGEAHRTTKNYKALKAKVGQEIFVKGDRMEPYYTAAFALYKLEYFFRSGRLEAKFKSARFHILLAARILFDPTALPKRNSHEMERRCTPLMETFWDSAKTDELITRAAAIVALAADGDFDRDSIRTEPFTQKVVGIASEAAKGA